MAPALQVRAPHRKGSGQAAALAWLVKGALTLASPRHRSRLFLKPGDDSMSGPCNTVSTVYIPPHHFSMKNVEQREKLESLVNIHIPPFKF